MKSFIFGLCVLLTPLAQAGVRSVGKSSLGPESFCGSLLSLKTPVSETVKERVRFTKYDVVTVSTAKAEDGTRAKVSQKALFGAEPQIVLGLDATRGDAPYLIIGNTLITIGVSEAIVDTSYNFTAEYTSDAISYRKNTLSAFPTRIVPAGIAFRLTHVPADVVTEIEARVNADFAGSGFQQTSREWQSMVMNLIAGLEHNLDAKLVGSRDMRESGPALKRLLSTGLATTWGAQLGVELYRINDGKLGLWRRLRGLEGGTNDTLEIFAAIGLVGAGVLSLPVAQILWHSWN